MKQTRFLVALAVVLMAIITVMVNNLAGELVPQDSAELNSKQARAYLDRVWITDKIPALNENCGIYFPENFPVANLKISIIGRQDGSDEEVDLLQDAEIKPDEWVIVEHLEDYTEAVAEFAIVIGDTVIARMVVDLLTNEVLYFE